MNAFLDISVLRQLIKDCPPEVYRQSEIKTLKTGEILFCQGETSQYVYIILKGNLKAYLCNPLGAKYFLLIQHAGQIVGEVETLLGGMPYIGTLEAIEDSTVLAVPQPMYERWLSEDHRFSLYVHKLLCNNFYLLIKKSAEDGLYPLKYRLMNLLGYLHGEDGPIQKKLLVETLGATEQSVEQILGELTEKGIAECRDGVIKVLSIDLLNKEFWLS
ncbi:cyclic nucleotide-binding protein [Hydrogenispora ethanolica]|jgi:CRP-like cAMP-binding protein|uniref:Cyclic nucleotide-binding protein n=1 Tax=Hydrogenispora ethanolica TaxID=1082276 RepID=A0A4R1S4R4_HYDET|nr:Crp/Fnr family transcriptional regulator [Hydrogenispora ethanolica]TCL74275.1 cyclic nucleotide-binding protein [Hydrogenispora ethanolica]